MRELRFKVWANWDEEAQVWFVAKSNVPGLCAEAKTQEELERLIRIMIPELVSLNGLPEEAIVDKKDHTVPWEVIWKQEGRLALGC